MLLVSGATKTVARLAGDPHLGVLLTPRAGNRVDVALELGLPYACDNAAFSGFDETKFLRMLGRVAGRPGCLWATAPDTVANAAATLDQFKRWEPLIRSHGLPVAFVLQDGQERLPVPWDHLDAVFIGGSTDWKLGPHARQLVAEAKVRGKLSHCGRVNSRARIRYAAGIGCDSVDGSGWSMWPDLRLPKGLAWIKEATSGPS
jgi:hypothetical protein